MEQLINIGDDTYYLTSDDNYLASKGDTFERDVVDLFGALIEPDDIVADIGANIGLTAILFSNLAERVVAFEPSATTFNILNDNVLRAGRSNITTVNCGLGNKAESLNIVFNKNDRSGGFVGIKTEVPVGHVTETINIETLDEYCLAHSIVPTFIKIDVEGFEQNVLMGGSKTLALSKPTVVMEMNHFCLDVLQRITIPDFLDYIRSVFPYLYAIDSGNTSIMDLHNSDEAYFVMHEHVVNNRFLNLVGGYSSAIKPKLESLKEEALNAKQAMEIATPTVTDFSGSIKPDVLEILAVPSEVIEIPVTLINSGEDTWSNYGKSPVLLSYHWQRSDGTVLIFDGIRSAIQTGSVGSGTSVNEIVRVFPPNETGSFILTLTALQEYVCWFEDRGFICWRGIVNVGSPPTSAKH